MPVNHAKEFLNSIHAVALFFMAVFGNFDQLVLTHYTYFQIRSVTSGKQSRNKFSSRKISKFLQIWDGWIESGKHQGRSSYPWTTRNGL